MKCTKLKTKTSLRLVFERFFSNQKTMNPGTPGTAANKSQHLVTRSKPLQNELNFSFSDSASHHFELGPYICNKMVLFFQKYKFKMTLLKDHNCITNNTPAPIKTSVDDLSMQHRMSFERSDAS